MGAVVIGRNEGPRLGRCLDSLAGRVASIVYVDSGSSDDSLAVARGRGADVIELDRALPFTAARARNAGWRHLLAARPDLEVVQLIDGDSELFEGWLGTAAARLRARPDLAAVCGRLRERYPQRSIYNRLADVEWDTPVGDALACGGNAMMRLSALEQTGGFREDLIAGEEPELCLRLRRRGWRIERLAEDMAWHDAALTRFSQFWRRAVRAGHTYAEGAFLHGASPDRHYVREHRRAWLWGGVVPAVALGAAVPTWGLSLALLCGYPVSAARVYRHVRGRGRSRDDALVAGLLLTVGKFAEFHGVLRFRWRRFRNRPPALIEYK